MSRISPERREKQSRIFKEAWKKAREAAKKYGGKASQYFVIKGKNALSDAYTTTKEIDEAAKNVIVDPDLLPSLKFEDWHERYATLYYKLEKESHNSSSSKSFLIVNFAENDFDINMKKYRDWEDEGSSIKTKSVIAALKTSWKNINGRKVTYIAKVNLFVYEKEYEALKNNGYTDKDIEEIAEHEEE